MAKRLTVFVAVFAALLSVTLSVQADPTPLDYYWVGGVAGPDANPSESTKYLYFTTKNWKVGSQDGTQATIKMSNTSYAITCYILNDALSGDGQHHTVAYDYSTLGAAVVTLNIGHGQENNTDTATVSRSSNLIIENGKTLNVLKGGTFKHTGGLITIENGGTFYVNGGSYSSDGIINLTLEDGGYLSITATNSLKIASSNALTIKGGTAEIYNKVYVGTSSAGSIVQSNGTATFNDALVLGWGSGKGTYNLSGGTLTTTNIAGLWCIRNAATSTPNQFNVTGGTANFNQQGNSFVIGLDTDGTTNNYGTASNNPNFFNLYSGTVNAADTFVVQYGGTLNVAQNAVEDPETHEVTVTGGDGLLKAKAIKIDNGGILDLSSGTIKLGSGGITHTNNAGSYTINLSGGTFGTNGDSWSTSLNANLASGSTVTFAPDADKTITWGGAFTGSGGKIVKTGAGTLKLNYAGYATGDSTKSMSEVIVNGGKMIVDATSSVFAWNSTTGFLGSASVTVNENAELEFAQPWTADPNANVTVNNGTLTLYGDQYVNKLTLNSATVNNSANSGELHVGFSGPGVWSVQGGESTINHKFSIVKNGNYGFTINFAKDSTLNVTKEFTGNESYPGMDVTFQGPNDGVGNINITTTSVMTNLGAITFNNMNGTIAAAIQGSSSITKSGDGTVTLSNTNGNNSYTGGTTVSGGTLILQGTNNAKSSVGTGDVTINSGAAIVAQSHNVFGGGAASNIPNVIINGGSLTPNQYLHMKSLEINGGTVNSHGDEGDGLDFSDRNGVITSTGNSSIASAIKNSSTLTIDVTNGTLSLTGYVNNSTSYKTIKTGAGILTTSNGISGLVEVQQGTLQITENFDSGKRFNGEVTINQNAILDCAEHDSLGWGGATTKIHIYGLMDNSKGNETLNNTELHMYGGTAQSSSGGTFDILSTGTKFYSYALTEAPTVSTISSDLLLRTNGTFEIDTAANSQLKLTGSIQTGTDANYNCSITKLGDGTLKLTAANGYKGNTTISRGNLILSQNGTLGNGNGSVSIDTNGTLTFAGDMTSQPTTTINNKISGAGTIVKQGASNFTVNLDGNLTEFTGNMTISGGTLSALMNGTNKSLKVTNLSGPGNLELRISNGAGNIEMPNLQNDNFSGVISLVNNNCTDDSKFYANGKDFDGFTFRINDGTTLYFENWNVPENKVLKANVLLSGNGNTKGYGALRANYDMSGDITVMDNATIGFDRDNNRALSGDIVSGAESDVTLSIQPNWATTSGTISGDISDTNTSKLSVAIIQKSDATNNKGTFTFSGNLSYKGETSVATGQTLSLTGTGTNLVNSSAVAVNGTLDVTGYTGSTTMQLNKLSGAGNVNLGAKSVKLNNVADADTEFSGNINGTGNVTKTGAGTLTLSKAPAYTGSTTIEDGTLKLKAGGTVNNLSGEASGTLDFGANALTLSNSDNSVFAGALTGSGNVTKTGSGTLTLSQPLELAGDTTIDGGTLDLTNGGSLNNLTGTGTLNISAPITITTQPSDDVNVSKEFAGKITGTGSLTKAGAGTQILSGANTYTGLTTVSKGVLELTGSAVAANGPVSIAADGTLIYYVGTDENDEPITKKLSINDTNTILGTGKVIKDGDGTLQIYNEAEHLINVGSLLVSSGRLDLKGYMDNGIEVDAGGVFSPGNSVGDAVFGGGYVLKDGALLLIEMDASGVDTLTVDSFTLANNQTQGLENTDTANAFGKFIQLQTNGVALGSQYDIITSKTDFSGQLLNEDYWISHIDGDFPAGMSLKVVDNKIVRLLFDHNSVPEPSTWALLLLGAAGMMYWRKRKNAK